MQQTVAVCFTPSSVKRSLSRCAYRSIVVSSVRITAVFDSVDIQNLLAVVTLSTESELADSEL